MCSGFIKRAGATVLDVMLIVIVVSFLYVTFAKPIIIYRIEDYKSDMVIHNDLTKEYFDSKKEILGYCDDGTYDDIQCENELDTLTEEFEQDIKPYQDKYAIMLENSITFYFAAFFILASMYSVVLNGKTLGRSIMFIEYEASENESRFTLFVREFVFKYSFWIFTLGIGLIVDSVLCIYRKDNKTVRDLYTRTSIVDKNLNEILSNDK